MKLNKTDDVYSIELTDEDKVNIWTVLNEYRQYRLTASEGEKEVETLFVNLLNGVPNPTEHLLEKAKRLAKVRSESHNN